MKKIACILAALVLLTAAKAQTLNVVTGNVTYQFPASSMGDMTYNGGTTLTVKGKTFAISDITKMYVDDASTAARYAIEDNTAGITYNGNTASVTVAGNVAQYVTPSISGAHVSIVQSNTDDVDGDEITYSLSGTSSDGEFYMKGSYKATIDLNGVTLTNATPVYSGAALHVQNGKRINISVKKGTENTLTDCASPSDDLAQKAALYVKGHAEFKGKGTLNVYGNYKHAIKTGEYISVKNCTINVKRAADDGFNCNEYFLMESGTLDISGVGDEGIQTEIDEDIDATAETTDHEDENSGNLYILDGSINIASSVTDVKGIKAIGAISISGGDINVSTTHEAIESKSTISITGGSIYAQSKDDAINSGSTFTITGGTICGYSTGNDGLDANGNFNISGGTTYAISSRSPEVGIDANTEGRFKLTITGGTVVAIGGLESGSTLSQTCYQLGSSSNTGGNSGGRPGGGNAGGGSQSWTANTWYSLYSDGNLALAFKTPSSGGSALVVTTAGTVTMKSGGSASGTFWNGMGATSISGDASVDITTYSSGNSFR